MNRKKLLCVLLAVATVCCNLPVMDARAQSLAAEWQEETRGMQENSEGEAEFQIEDGVLVKYTGDGGDVVIPEGVSSIGDAAFEECKDLISITIPEGVTSIGDSAFWGCSSLTDIIIPKRVTVIGSYAFGYCNSLTSITIHGNISSIGEDVFEKTPWLKKERIRNPLVIINHILIDGQTVSGDVVIPEEVTSIAESAFKGCSGLTSIKIPEGITNIEYGMFYGCSGLNDITIPESVISIGNFAFAGCSVLTDIRIPENVTSIGKDVFWECHEDLILLVTAGSYAETYAKGNDIPYRYINESGHTHSYQSQITKQPGCTIAGVRTYICSECGDSYTEPITATGHRYVTTISAASIGKDGSITKTCTECGDKASTTIYAPKTISLSKTEGTYNGKQQTPNVIVRDSKGKLLSNKTDYTVSYPKTMKNVGSYTVVINFKGNYSGTAQKNFTIVPKGTSISKVTPKKKGFTVKWKKQAVQTTGYDVAYSTDSKFSKKNTKIVSVKKNSVTSKTINKLKAKKKYYVRVRTYKTIKGKKYYSGWSKVKKITSK